MGIMMVAFSAFFSEHVPSDDKIHLSTEALAVCQWLLVVPGISRKSILGYVESFFVEFIVTAGGVRSGLGEQQEHESRAAEQETNQSWPAGEHSQPPQSRPGYDGSLAAARQFSPHHDTHAFDDGEETFYDAEEGKLPDR